MPSWCLMEMSLSACVGGRGSSAELLSGDKERSVLAPMVKEAGDEALELSEDRDNIVLASGTKPVRMSSRGTTTVRSFWYEGPSVPEVEELELGA